ncbi:MAG: hypothetical protein JW932_19050 [Deltaproteobacteria bacterium]|nr:hypothetical protein [Deltaproteobacteria bacterium]
MKNQISIDERKIRADRKIIDVCRKENVNILESRGGSRRGRLSEVGAELAKALVRRHGLTFAETAR